MSVFRQRRGTAAALAAANETPAAGQIIFEIDTNRIKIGDGVKSYTELSYLDNEVAVSDVAGLRAELDGLQSAISGIQQDSRWTNARAPADGSVTAAKLASNLLIDGPRYQHRRGTAAALAAANPTPAAGEIVVETDSNRVKVGDGTSNYNTLAYLTTGQAGLTAPASARLDPLVFNGTTTQFTMRVAGTAITPPSYAYLLISINGVIQEPGVAYLIAGSVIQFGVAPAATDTFFGLFIGGSAPHSHSAADVTSGTLSTDRLPATLVYTSDSRLTNARTPTSHKASHQTGGVDALAPADIGAAAAVHTHGISDVVGLASALDGKQAIGTVATHTHDASAIVSGILSPDRIPLDIVRTTDARMGDARTPTIHKVSHQTGGVDALAPADIGAAPAVHTHAISSVTGLAAALNDRASATHEHDHRYYTQLQMNSILSGYAQSFHTHAIDTLDGVTINSLANGDVLRFSSGQWRNYPDTGLVDGGNF